MTEIQRDRGAQQHRPAGASQGQLTYVQDNLMKLINDSKCKLHSEDYALFCQTDKKLLCLSCVYRQATHKNHLVHPINGCYSLLQNENSNFLAQVKEKSTCIEDRLKHLDHQKQQLDIMVNTYKENVQQETLRLHEALGARMQQTIEQLQDYYEESMQ